MCKKYLRISFRNLFQINHDATIHCLAWSPETTMAVAPRKLKFATGASDYCIRVFSSDLGQNETLRVLKGHRDYVNAIAFHPQEEGGQLVSASDDHTVSLWDVKSGHHLHTVTFGKFSIYQKYRVSSTSFSYRQSGDEC